MYNILLLALVLYLLFDRSTIENFVEYDYHSKYISVKHENKQFVHPEYLIDPYISQKGTNMVLKEYRYMKNKKMIKKVFKKCYPNSTFGFSKDTLLLAYYIDNTLVGFVGMLTTKQLEKYLSSLDKPYTDAYIYGIVDQHGLYMHNLCVLPEYRGKGIGSSLIKGVIQFANEIRVTYINLLVDRKNDKAIKLYSKFKFKMFYESRDQMSGNHMIAMVKYIGQKN